VTEFKDKPSFLAKVPLCRLIERQSAKGTRFLSGFLGDAKIVMFQDPDCPPGTLMAASGHAPGTGKSYLVDVISTIATGRLCPVIEAGKTEEENSKRLGALLRDGAQIVSLDNVNGELGGEFLCQLTERPLVKVRILGRSEAPEFECKSAVFATGNNLVVAGDMTRRTLICSLGVEMERPEQRQFKCDPISTVLENRGAYVAAVFTIVRAYIAAGRPRVCDPIGSYGVWSETVRAPLIWLGEKDPVESMETAREEDPELNNIRELFEHLETAFGQNSKFATAQVIEKANNISGGFDNNGGGDTAFADFLNRVAPNGRDISAVGLGKFFGRVKGRIVDGKKLIQDGKLRGNRTFLLKDANANGR
jgi:hypothetical protein